MHAPRSALVGAACLEVCVVLVMDDNRPADSESPIESNSTSFADCLSPPPNNGIAAPVTCSLALWPVYLQLVEPIGMIVISDLWRGRSSRQGAYAPELGLSTRALLVVGAGASADPWHGQARASD